MLINVDDLLLWPDNPRLKFGNFEQHNLKPHELAKDQTQANLQRYLEDEEHNLKDLIASIAQNGFRTRESLIVVFQKEIQKYYVIEGNRRLASVRSINSNGGDKIKQLPCCEFVHKEEGGVDFKSAVNLCVAECHYLGGKKDHSGIQKAKVIYEIYWTFINENTSIPRYRFDSRTVKRTGEFLGGLSDKEVKKEISIARIYDQLVDLNYKVDHKRRERLSWAFENEKVFYTQFGFNSKDSLQLSNSVEEFYNLFIKTNCPVSSPVKLKEWLYVVKHRRFNLNWSHLMINEPGALTRKYLELKGWVQNEEVDDDSSPVVKPGIEKKLSKILKDLEKIKIDEYGSTKNEDTLIQQLKKIINDKFGRLLLEDVTDSVVNGINSTSGSDNENSTTHKIATKEDILGTPI